MRLYQTGALLTGARGAEHRPVPRCDPAAPAGTRPR